MTWYREHQRRKMENRTKNKTCFAFADSTRYTSKADLKIIIILLNFFHFFLLDVTKRAKVRCRPTKSSKIIQKMCTHWKLLCLFPNIISHSYISRDICLFVVSASNSRKRGGRGTTTLTSHSLVHMYMTLSMFCFFLFFISLKKCFLVCCKNITWREWRKKSSEKISTAPKVYQATTHKQLRLVDTAKNIKSSESSRFACV